MNRQGSNYSQSPSRGFNRGPPGPSNRGGFRRMKLWDNFQQQQQYVIQPGWSCFTYDSFGMPQMQHGQIEGLPNQQFIPSINNYSSPHRKQTGRFRSKVHRRLNNSQNNDQSTSNTYDNNTEDNTNMSGSIKKFKRNQYHRSSTNHNRNIFIYKKDEDPESIPKEALECYICNATSFKSTKEYRQHLTSKSHKRRLFLHRELNDNTLLMLKAHAKLATDNEKIALKSEKGKMMYCYKCCCHFWVSKTDHFKSIEHQLVKGFSMTKCCGHVYHYQDPAGNYQLEEHKLSLFHLKKEYEKKQRDVSVEDGANMEVESGDECSNFKLTFEDRISLLQYPKFHPSQPFAMDVVEKTTDIECKACKVHIQSEDHVPDHCKTTTHFEAVVKLFKEQQDKMNVEMMEKIESSKEEKEEEVFDNEASVQCLENEKTSFEVEVDVDEKNFELSADEVTENNSNWNGSIDADK